MIPRIFDFYIKLGKSFDLENVMLASEKAELDLPYRFLPECIQMNCRLEPGPGHATAGSMARELRIRGSGIIFGLQILSNYMDRDYLKFRKKS